jgi:protein involved in polysaccharide export with SLBB domain
MLSRYKTHSMLFLCLFCISCAGPNITIEKDTVYDKPIAEFPDEYYLGPGDVIEIIYHTILKPSEKAYILSVGDVIKIEFYYHPKLNREISIPPDGKIFLHLKGEIDVSGLTPSQLAEKLTRIYSDIFKDPSIAITLIEYDQAINLLKEAIANRDRGQSKLSAIRPDGFITLPLLPKDIKASGLTIPQLKAVVSKDYNKILNNLGLSLILETSKSNLVYVMGEVEKPDYYQMDTPTTLTQILSRAGGLLDTAKTNSILVLSRNKEKKPVGKLIDLDKSIGEGNIGNDLLLRQYDVVYVPRSTIADVNLFVDQYINKIIPEFFRTSLVFGYDVFRINPSP